MKFNSKQEFKQAIINYGLHERKEIKFIKDEGDRARAICSWPFCPWVCLLKKTSKFESWQVTSYKGEHICPMRRDSKLVTATRIANRFQKLIMANPQWSVAHLQQMVQEEMFANVHVSKIKKAKAIVVGRMMDAQFGEYGKVFDYQNELLRSNPGSTVIVKLHPNFEKPTFYRFYVCLEACRKGFLAGCRKVIGLDGCFFKGRPGELLCVVGRDANNQIYPIAWAAVDKETNDSWDWFCSILFNELKLGDGDGWVIISDQQKVLFTCVTLNLFYLNGNCDFVIINPCANLFFRVFLMPCKTGFQGLSTEIVLGTYMPIGERSIEIRIGRSFSGHAQKPLVQCCSTKQGLFWHNIHQMEQEQS
jgi:hypothetical protein